MRSNSLHLLVVLGAAILTILTSGGALPATAAVLTVDTLSAEPPQANGNCTLIEAIQAANGDVAVDACPAGSGADELRLPAGEMVFTAPFAGSGNALPVVDTQITIRGVGSTPTVLRRESLVDFRFFDVDPGARLELVNLELRAGRVVGQDGGAVRSRGAELEVTDCVLRDNRASRLAVLRGGEGATSEGGRGGGVFAEDGLTARRVTFVGNEADEDGGAVFTDGASRIDDSSFIANTAEAAGGGGIALELEGDSGEIRILNSTFVRNRSGTDGGAISTLNAPPEGGGSVLVELSFLTVIDNFSNGGASAAGGIFAVSPEVHLAGVLAIRNQSKAGGVDVGGSLTSGGANIVAISTAVGFGAFDLLGSAPEVGSFVDTGTAGGGHVPLLSGTAPVDFSFGGITTCPPVDQLGQPRPPGSCDAGAFELQGGGQPVEVPTLSTLGVVTLAGLLGLLATRRLSTP